MQAGCHLAFIVKTMIDMNAVPIASPVQQRVSDETHLN